jgi:hypothetical protein
MYWIIRGVITVLFSSVMFTFGSLSLTLPGAGLFGMPVPWYFPGSLSGKIPCPFGVFRYKIYQYNFPGGVAICAGFT